MANPLDDRKNKQYADAKAALAPAGGSTAAPAPAAPPAEPEGDEGMGMDDQAMEDARFQSIEDRLAAVEAQLGITSPSTSGAPAAASAPSQSGPAY